MNDYDNGHLFHDLPQDETPNAGQQGSRPVRRMPEEQQTDRTGQAKVKPLFVIGTRPEAIKLAPVIRECYRRGIECYEYFTCQHEVSEIVEHFGVGHYMLESEIACGLSSTRRFAFMLDAMAKTVEQTSDLSCIVAQGDTFSVVAAAMVAFYNKVPFVHVEAGLRTYNRDEPWPEEFNRRVVTLATKLHCCPTERASKNVLSEDLFSVANSDVFVVGNSVVDAMQWTLGHPDCDSLWNLRKDEYEGIVVVTAHRRENQGGGILRICEAVSILAARFPKTLFYWPAHPNPAVRAEMEQHPSWPSNVAITEPLRYPRMMALLNEARLVLTDSGGIQEECAALKKPCVILRNETERPEVVECGAGVCVGTDVANIVAETEWLLTDWEHYNSRVPKECPFGDGHSAEKIVDAMLSRFETQISN
jgi:UDP-N-acetylglucosamine 2-epimerase (non-hydrolysing)